MYLLYGNFSQCHREKEETGGSTSIKCTDTDLHGYYITRQKPVTSLISNQSFVMTNLMIVLDIFLHRRFLFFVLQPVPKLSQSCLKPNLIQCIISWTAEIWSVGSSSAFLLSSSRMIFFDGLFEQLELLCALWISLGVALYPPLLLVAMKKAQKLQENEAVQGKNDQIYASL